MERPAFIAPGSHTDNALSALISAIESNDDGAIGGAFQSIMAATPFVANDLRECARYEEIAAYVDALLEAHYG